MIVFLIDIFISWDWASKEARKLYFPVIIAF